MTPRKKRILVACGAALATSTVVARKIETELGRRGVEVETTQCSTAELDSRIAGHDLVVTTIHIPETGGVPVLHTVSFLTGVGMEADIARIIEILNTETTSTGRSRR